MKLFLRSSDGACDIISEEALVRDSACFLEERRSLHEIIV